MSIKFVTPGHLDLDLILTFGVSVKESDNPIGYFGTGFKFAVATLLRTGHTIKIIRTQHLLPELEFKKVVRDFRGKEFEMVQLEGADCGFTTQLGRNWQPWMAYRELHSNTLDEGGFTTDEEQIALTDGWTCIEVEGDEINKCHQDRSTIFCEGAVLASSRKLEVRSGQSKHLFYRGVRVLELERPSRFTYNLLADQTLTEDRTLKYPSLGPHYTAHYIAALQNKEVLEQILATPEGWLESKFNFEDADFASEEFLDACQNLCPSMNLNKTARRLAQKMGKIVEKEAPLDAIMVKKFDAACQFLKDIGYDPSPYRITVMELHGPLGLAKDGQIYLCPKAFDKGTKFLATVLLEEILHIKEGVSDETREMQCLLMDIITSLGEKVVGRAL